MCVGPGALGAGALTPVPQLGLQLCDTLVPLAADGVHLRLKLLVLLQQCLVHMHAPPGQSENLGEAMLRSRRSAAEDDSAGPETTRQTTADLAICDRLLQQCLFRLCVILHPATPQISLANSQRQSQWRPADTEGAVVSPCTVAAAAGGMLDRGSMARALFTCAIFSPSGATPAVAL